MSVSQNHTEQTPQAHIERRAVRRVLMWAAAVMTGLLILGFGYVAFALRSDGDANTRRMIELGGLKPDAPTIMAFATQERWMAIAQRRFVSECAQCHGLQGQGMSGPNLTDDYYINVRRLEDIYDIIANGRNHNAMPAWNQKFHPNQIVMLSSYVASLRGQNLKGRPRDHRAVLIEPWPDPVKQAEVNSDSMVKSGTTR